MPRGFGKLMAEYPLALSNFSSDFFYFKKRKLNFNPTKNRRWYGNIEYSEEKCSNSIKNGKRKKRNDSSNEAIISSATVRLIFIIISIRE